jgi:hypothetical protein
MKTSKWHHHQQQQLNNFLIYFLSSTDLFWYLLGMPTMISKQCKENSITQNTWLQSVARAKKKKKVEKQVEGKELATALQHFFSFLKSNILNLTVLLMTAGQF